MNCGFLELVHMGAGSLMVKRERDGNGHPGLHKFQVGT